MRIGILSHYHNSINYGGALQAYALCKIINDMGYECEQIDIDCFAECINLNVKIAEHGKTINVIKKYFRAIKPVYRAVNFLRYRKSSLIRKKLYKAFENFNENLIPHSAKQYNSQNITETLDIYDVFIVGSDQVWNPIWYFNPFFLSFVPNNVPKISYAASISQSSLLPEVKQLYKEHLKGFSSISVREKESVDLINDILLKKVEYVLDPTLLLDGVNWETLVSDRLIKDSYVFCYFLGEDKEIRNVASEYAKKNNLVLVNIKHATGQYHKTDINYGDISLDAPSPSEFLALIRYADMVFTDSFHASVFSFIFKRQFFVFERVGHKGMSTRVISLMELFETENRFCSTCERKTIQYIFNQQPIDYNKEFESFIHLKDKSINFLKDNLKTAEKKVVEK